MRATLPLAYVLERLGGKRIVCWVGFADGREAVCGKTVMMPATFDTEDGAREETRCSVVRMTVRSLPDRGGKGVRRRRGARRQGCRRRWSLDHLDRATASAQPTARAAGLDVEVVGDGAATAVTAGATGTF